MTSLYPIASIAEALNSIKKAVGVPRKSPPTISDENVNTELPHNPGMPLDGFKNHYIVEITSVFTVTPFITVRLWKHPRLC